MLVAGGIIAYVIGTARSSAIKLQKIDQNQAVELACEAVKKYDPNVDVSKLMVKDIDKRLNTSEGLDRAIRIYEVELDQGVVEYEVRVNAVTGETVITDIDY